MMRVKLIVAYDGTAYHGWQLQKNGNTIEAELNKHLSALLQENIQVIGASRTDAGVHAHCNVAVFDTDTRMPAEKISYALNQRLPEDIRIQGLPGGWQMIFIRESVKVSKLMNTGYGVENFPCLHRDCIHILCIRLCG